MNTHSHIFTIPLRIKLIIVPSMISILVSTFIYFYYPYKLKEQSIHLIKSKIESIQYLMQNAIGMGMGESDLVEISNSLDWVKKDSAVDYLVILDPSLKKIADYNPRNFSVKISKSNNFQYEENGVLHTQVAIYYEGKALGILLMGYNLNNLNKSLAAIRQTALLSSLLFCMIGVACAFLVSFPVTRNIRILSNAVEKSVKENALQPVDIQSGDEIGQFASAYNNMILKLDDAHSNLNSLITNIREIFFSADMTLNKTVLISPACIEIYGYQPEDFYKDGELWFKIIHPDFKKEVGESLKDLWRGKIVEHEYVIIKKNGRTCWVETRITPTLDENGRLVRVDGITTDISKRKNAQTGLSDKIKELNTFIYRASHDLRGPLTSLMGLVNVASYGLDLDEAMDCFGMIKGLGNKMDIALSGLINAANISDNKIKPSEMDLRDKIQLLEAGLQDIPDFNSVSFIADVKAIQPFVTDKNLFGLIMRNIAINAIKYRRTDVKSFVKISIRDEYEGIKIDISDNGIGIKDGYKDRIFEMFFRASAEQSGSGLGLYIVKMAVEKLNGKISVESKEENGTTVSVYLPTIHEAVLA